MTPDLAYTLVIYALFLLATVPFAVVMIFWIGAVVEAVHRVWTQWWTTRVR